MKKLTLALLTTIAAGSLAGCDAIDAIKATKAMPGYMESMTGKMDTTNGAINKTNAAVHQQKLLLALTELLKKENTQFLMPPTGMLAPGKAFAREATSKELVELAYVWLKEIDKTAPDEALKGPDGKYPESVIAAADRDKLVKLVALEVIAGFIAQNEKDVDAGEAKPNGTIEEIVREQIEQGGRYESTAYALLAARALFVKDVLVEPLLEEKLTNIGMVREAVARVEYLDYLARAPFADKLRIRTKGMLNRDNNVDEKFDPRTVLPLWEKLDRAVKAELEPRYADSPLVKELRERIEAGKRK